MRRRARPKRKETMPRDPLFEKKMEKAADIMHRYRNTLHALSNATRVARERRSPQG